MLRQLAKSCFPSTEEHKASSNHKINIFYTTINLFCAAELKTWTIVVVTMKTIRTLMHQHLLKKNTLDPLA